MALKNDTFGDLKNLTFALIGREYADSTASYGRLKTLWNYAAKKAYRQTPWWERFLVIGDERLVVNKNKVPRDEDSKNSIDTYLRIYDKNPELARGYEYKFIVDANGATLTGKAASDEASEDVSVFVTHKKAYEPNYGNAGDSEEIPSEFMPYMAHLTAYTWQRSVEQNSDEQTFSLSLALVNSILEDELAKMSDQNFSNSYLAKNIRTNYNQLII